MEHLFEILPVLLYHAISGIRVHCRCFYRPAQFLSEVSPHHYLSALRRLHVFCHFDTSGFDDIHVKLTR